MTRRGEVGAALAAVLVARTAVNGGLRVVYPFLPEIARGLGVSFATLATLVSLRSLAGVAAPAAARAAEALGRRALMVGATTAVAAGCLLVAGAPTVAVAAAGFLLVGLAKPAFDVPMQAWFADRVPWARRGRVLGVTELAWALSLAVTVPPSGVLIVAAGWRAPFVLVAVLAAIGVLAVAGLIPTDRPPQRRRARLALTRPRLALLGVVLLFSVSAELLFVVYGAWLEDDLGLSVTAIGTFTLVVVAAELVGEGAVAALSDRVGLRRAIMAGLLGSAGAYAALGLVGGSLAAAVLTVVAWFVCLEVTIVATVPFVSELATDPAPDAARPPPPARDRLLALMVAVIAAGRALGAVVAPAAYAAGGITASGRVAAAGVLLAAVLLLRVPSPG